MVELISKYRTSLLVAICLCIAIAVMIFVVPETSIAQPGLPSSPDQTPIDGGLGILAALGGTYAIKKLREKKDV